MYSKTCVKWLLSKRHIIGFHDQILLYLDLKYCRMLRGEHSAILLTFIKLPFVIKIFVLSILSDPFTQVLLYKPNNFIFLNHKWANTWYFGTYCTCAKAPFKRQCWHIQGAGDMNFGLSLHLHLYFVHTSSEGAAEYANLHRLVWTFIDRQCARYPNRMCWLKYVLEQLNYDIYSDEPRTLHSMQNGRCLCREY